MDISFFSLTELKSLVDAGTLTREAVYDHFLARAKQYNGDLNAFNTLPPDTPEYHEGILSGLPIAVKDLFCETGIRTTAASKMLEHFVPPYESTVTDRLKKEGMTSFGKTNLDEFAMGGSGENSAFGPARNPWDESRIPGGSSSGSAAAVAAGLVPAALGTDTGGSIRQPASMCGVVGWKPGYGRNSRYGVIAMSSSLDCPGYFTRTVRDAGMLYEITAGADPLDATTLPENTSLDSTIWGKRDLTGVRVGVPREYFIDGIDDEVRMMIEKAIDTLKNLGAEIVDISLPHTEHGLAVYYIVCPAEVSSNMARFDGIRFGHKAEGGLDIAASRDEGIGREVQRRSMVGSFVLSAGFYDAYYKKASDIRELIREDFRSAFDQVDVIVTPTAPTVAWKIGEKGEDPLKMYLSDIFTIPASLAGLPGLALPVGFAHPSGDEGVEMPVGMQILGPVLGEEKCLMVGHILEQAIRDELAPHYETMRAKWK